MNDLDHDAQARELLGYPPLEPDNRDDDHDEALRILGYADNIITDDNHERGAE
jgi:hypothetical protein